jgi:outer membrane receptor protein involved in Fe transport
MQAHQRLGFGIAGLFVLTAFAGFAQAQPQASSAEDLQEVVVTGSRVITNGNDSPTPLTVVTIAQMQEVHPGSVADQLNDMPQFSGSRGQLTNPQVGSASNGNPNSNANVLNLRNFGVQRTMILFDGHRVAPTSGDGGVDVDMIPQLLLQRVDVVTGGASAVYGSDAVTGVVNFVTDTKFVGLKINGQAGESVFHDDPTNAIGIAWGTDLFGSRGHLEASLEHRGDGGVAYQSSRPLFASRPVVEPLPQIPATSTSPAIAPYALYYYVTNADKSFGGTVSQIGNTANPLAGQFFCQNGVLCPYSHGTPLNGGQWEQGGDGAYFSNGLKAALNMDQAFARLDYDFTDDLHGYVKASGTYNYNTQYSLTQPTDNPANASNGVPILSTNPYLPAQYQQALAAAGVTAFNVTKTQSDAPREFAETFEHQYAVDTGLQGKFGNGYDWELAYIYGYNELATRQDDAQNALREAAALDSVIVTSANVGSSGLPIGSIACNVTLTNPGLYPGCVPYNPFGPSSMSAAAERYIFQPITVTETTTMNDVEGNVRGAPFSSWAGPINTALSAEWRELTFKQDSTSTLYSFLNPINCTGLRVVQTYTPCTVTSQEWFQGASPSGPRHANVVAEGAVEANLPLLKDVPLAKDVSLDSAFRYTHYSISGTVTTWKLGLDWKFNDSLTLRATRSRDIDAPTLFELFQPIVAGNFNGTDFVTSCALNGTTKNTKAPCNDGLIHQPASTFQQGNPNLKPEKGDTTTVGFVYKPGWAPGLSMTLDGYLINLRDAILNQNGNSQAVQTGCFNSGGASPLCSLVVRPNGCCDPSPANSVTAVYAEYLNIANQWTEGADFELNYNSRLMDKPVNLRLLTAYQPHNVNVVTGTGTTDNAGYFGSAPVWRAEGTATINPTDDWKISVQERWRDRMAWVPKQSAPLPTLVFLGPSISDVFYTNLNVSYTVPNFAGGKTEFFANIANLFDRQPVVAAAYNNVQPGIFGVVPGDDVIGRYYTIGFRYRR